MLSISSLLVLLSPLSAASDAPALAEQAGLPVSAGVELSAIARESSSVARGGRVDLLGTVDGIPLARSFGRVWLGKDGTPLVAIGGDTIGPLATSGPPTVDLQSAIALLEDSGHTGSRGAATGTLVIDGGAPESRAVWRIDPPVDPRTLDNHVFFVDAHSGAVTIAFNRTRRASVEVFPVNPTETPQAEIVELNELDETAEFLEGQYFRLRNCVLEAEDQPCSAQQPTLVPDENGDFFYPVPDISDPAQNIARGDPYAEVSAYYNADRFHAFLASFGDPGLLCSQGETQTSISVNRHTFANGEPEWFDNAFYTGACSGITSTIVMGQGTNYDFAWDGEIVIHELGHGITDRQVGDGGVLGLPRRDEYSAGNDAGAINEGTSDYFGTVLSGQRIYSDYTQEFARDLGTDATCPAGLPGEIHDDGILWATALHDITDELGLDFVPVVIDTLGMLEFDTSFDAASVTLEAITRDVMGDDAGDLVAEVMDARGLTECTRVAPIEDARFGMWMLTATWDVDFFPVRPPPFQVYFDVPPNAIGMTVSFDPFTFDPGPEPQWLIELLLKSDEPIVFTYEEGAGQVVVDADSSEQHSFEDDNTWTRKVTGGEQLYGAFVNRGSVAMRMDDITVEYELAPDMGSSSGSSGGGTAGPGPETSTGPEDPSTSTTAEPATSTSMPPDGSETSDTDTDGDPSSDGDNGGCGCQSLDSSPHGTWLLLGMLGLVFRRRRSLDRVR